MHAAAVIHNVGVSESRADQFVCAEARPRARARDEISPNSKSKSRPRRGNVFSAAVGTTDGPSEIKEIKRRQRERCKTSILPYSVTAFRSLRDPRAAGNVTPRQIRTEAIPPPVRGMHPWEIENHF